MPITDSMTPLWLIYGGVSLVVLISGYFGLAFLPRLLRLPITWLVAGMMWAPARFHLPLVEEGEFYTGLAPAVVVAAVGVLERDSGMLLPALLICAAGAAAGAAFGVLLWGRGRRRVETDDTHDDERGAVPTGRARNERREPVIG